jgi:hypothetical protein
VLSLHSHRHTKHKKKNQCIYYLKTRWRHYFDDSSALGHVLSTHKFANVIKFSKISALIN